MKKFFKYLFSFLLTIPMFFALTACGGDAGNGGDGGGSGDGGSNSPSGIPAGYYQVMYYERDDTYENETLLGTALFEKGTAPTIAEPSSYYDSLVYHSGKIFNEWRMSYNDSTWGWCEDSLNIDVITYQINWDINNNIIKLYADYFYSVQPVTYELNGGINHANNGDTYIQNTELGIPTKDGFYFSGWTYTSDDPTIYCDEPTRKLSLYSVPTGIIFTAHWEEYVIRFATIGDNSIDDIHYSEGDTSVALPTTGVEKYGCFLKGWSLNENTSPDDGTYYTNEIAVSPEPEVWYEEPVCGEITLYPVWDTKLRIDSYGAVSGFKSEYQDETHMYVPAEFNGLKITSVSTSRAPNLKFLQLENDGEFLEYNSYSPSYNFYVYSSTIETLYCPKNFEEITIYTCQNLKNLHLGDKIKKLSLYDSDYTNNVLTTLNLPNSIEELSLGNLLALQSIDFGPNLKSLMITNNNAMKSINIPKTYDGFLKLENMTALEEATLPITVPENNNFTEEIFINCSNIKKITINKTNVEWFSYTFSPFKNLVNLEEVVIEDITEIYQYYFSAVPNLKKVTINGPVTKVGIKAFYNSPCLESVTFNNTTQMVLGESLFEECVRFKNFTYQPNTITQLPNKTFYNCYALETFTALNKINIAQNVFENSGLKVFNNSTNISSIGAYSFKNTKIINLNLTNITDTYMPQEFVYNCSLLESVELPNTITYISNSCFAECPKLNFEDMSVFYNVTAIENGAFKNTAITNFNSWDQLDNIGSSVFEDCKQLTSVDLSKGTFVSLIRTFKNTPIEGEVEIPGRINRYASAFNNCNSVTKLKFSAGETIYMAELSIDNMDALEEIEFNKVFSFQRLVLVSEGTHIFGKLISLEKIIDVGEKNLLYYFSTYDGYENPTEHFQVYTPTGSDTTYYIPKTLTTLEFLGGNSAYAKARGWESETLTTLILHEDVKSVEYFKNCINLENIDMSTVKDVGVNAFAGCTKLKTIDLSNVESIGGNAFTGCTELTGVDLSNIVSIGQSAFEGCTKITTIDLSNLNSVGEKAFLNCTNLIINNDLALTSLGESAFENCSLININIDLSGLTQTNIPASAFKNCENIKSFTLPTTIVEVQSYAFYNCKNANFSIEFDGSVKFGSYAFAESGITSVKLKSSLNDDSGEYVFLNCKNLKIFTFRSSEFTTYNFYLHKGFFKGCTAIETIDITNVKYVYEEVFADCTSLKEIKLNTERETYFDESALTGTTSLEQISLNMIIWL
ncbi:MAG: leucine-rich repeat protein [Clostridia bacterium]|nr:leucine-rich repeat protein [Clostridia bacterium]